LPVGWAMFGIWSVAVAARWFSAVASWRWQLVWPVSGTLELAVALLLLWQSTASGTSRRKRELWELVIFAGLGGLAATLALQLALVLRVLPSPVIPRESDLLLITLALWIFCFPVVWGFSGRLLPTFLGLRRSGIISGYAGLGLLAIAAALFTANRPQWGAVVIVGAVISACWSLRIFHPAERAAKLAGVDPLYPRFVRGAYAWLVISSLLGLGAASPGLVGASRHAFTVGFLATMIFAIGPRIRPFSIAASFGAGRSRDGRLPC
jgi:uncharacterized protein involved in response to NO